VTIAAGTRQCGARFDPVPKIVHQTWKTDRVPDEWRPFQASWTRAHSDWQYRLWTDADNRQLVADRYPWFLATYDAFPRDIQRVDSAKYFILDTHGGIYADLDCECMKPLDALTSRGGAIVSRTRDGVIDAAVLASPPGHVVWQRVFEQLRRPTLSARLLRVIPGFQASHVLLTTGTRMLKRVVGRYLESDPPPDDGLTVLDARFFSSRSWLDRREAFDERDAFVRHHYSDSWLIPSERLVVAALTRRRLRVALCLLALSAIVLALRWP